MLVLLFHSSECIFVICIYIYVCVCMCVCMCVCVCACEYVYICFLVMKQSTRLIGSQRYYYFCFIHPNVYLLFAFIYLCVYVCVYVCACECMYIVFLPSLSLLHACALTHTNKQTNTHTHTPLSMMKLLQTELLINLSLYIENAKMR